MWANSVNRDRLQRVESSTAGHNQWHRDDAGHLYAVSHPTEEVESNDFGARHQSGTWGERDVGGFDPDAAAAQFEALRRNLTQLSRKETQSTLRRTASARSGLSRIPTRSSAERSGTVRTSSIPETREEHTDLEAQASAEEKKEGEADDEDEFELDEFVREGHFVNTKKVGVIYKNLTVKGLGSTATFVRTLPDAIIGTFGPDLYKIVTRYIPSLDRKHGELRTLINGFSGCVRDGEMMLVLGRPGSGCSTFLKAIANNRGSFAQVTGDVSYGGITAEKQNNMYRGEVNYNPEDDIHFANLNVW